MSKEVQDHGIEILYPLHGTGFEIMEDDGKKEAETTGEYILCSILNLKNFDNDIFSDLNKCVKNDYVMKKPEHPKTVTSV